MNRVLTALIVALALATGSASAELVRSAGAPGLGHGKLNPAGDPISFTQSVDPATVTANNSIHCGSTGTPYHAPNSYVRRFALAAEFGIVNALTVNSVDIAHEEATTDSGEPQPIDVNLYTIPTGAALTFGALAPLASETIMVPSGTELAFENVPIGAVIADPTVEDLVVEIFSPDGRDPVFASYWPGSNDLGETGPSYIAAPDCSLDEPTALADVGFPGMHLIVVVNGETPGTIPTVESSWSAVKGLYR